MKILCAIFRFKHCKNSYIVVIIATAQSVLKSEIFLSRYTRDYVKSVNNMLVEAELSYAILHKYSDHPVTTIHNCTLSRILGIIMHNRWNSDGDRIMLLLKSE
jgi:hypothetical protein